MKKELRDLKRIRDQIESPDIRNCEPGMIKKLVDYWWIRKQLQKAEEKFKGGK